jgi:hypothetical protein
MNDTHEPDLAGAFAEAPAAKAQVRAWLLDYAWMGPAGRDARIVDCILAQDGWKYIDAVADQFAGAQDQPGPAAFSDGVGFALSALYECHDGPHQPTCPYHQDSGDPWADRPEGEGSR